MNQIWALINYLPPSLLAAAVLIPLADCATHCYTYAQCETHCYDDGNHWYYCIETCKT